MAATGLRLTGGRLGGRRIRVPPSGTRPSSDRVRESLFQRLGDLSGAFVLDLYAGGGTLGIEAISRGADAVVFVERAAGALAVLRANLASLSLSDRARVVSADARRAVHRLGREGLRFDLVLLDPPYGSEELSPVLAALVEAAVLAPGARVVVEHGRRHPVPTVGGLAWLDERRYGETMITRLRGEEAQP